MSQTETHFGKLKKVELTQPVEDWCKDECTKLGKDSLPRCFSSWKELLMDLTRYDKYFFLKDEVWEAIEHVKSDGDSDIDIMIPNEDGTISFVQQFYNGGTCLSECIENSLLELKKTQKTQ